MTEKIPRYRLVVWPLRGTSDSQNNLMTINIHGNVLSAVLKIVFQKIIYMRAIEYYNTGDDSGLLRSILEIV